MPVFLDPKAPAVYSPPGQDHLPEDKRVSYHLRVPTVADEVRLDREVAAAGGRWTPPVTMLALLRRGIRALLTDEAEAEARDNLLESVDEAESALRRVWEFGAAAASDPGDDGKLAAFRWAQADFEALDGALAQVVALVRQLHAPYAQAEADNAVYTSVVGMVATRLFVVGWEGLPGKAERGITGLTDKALARVPSHHRTWIGQEVRRLMRPTEEEAGN